MKFYRSHSGVNSHYVALYMSAWIEIGLVIVLGGKPIVALYMSAWIEIGLVIVLGGKPIVALYMSAWIEICRSKDDGGWLGSHSI